MKEINKLKSQKAILELDAARALYDFRRIQSNYAWDYQSRYVDFDPRVVDPNCSQEELEIYHQNCRVNLLIARIKEMEKSKAFQILENAKVKVLELQED